MMQIRMPESHEERFRLAMPIADAVAFALDRSDLTYTKPPDALRHVIGLLALDALEFSEQWRSATILRRSLARRWPDAGF